jgi:putative protein-disulfide isomerase
MVQNAWQQVATKTGAEFNWDFWEVCEPRRSTYLACRAVIAAGDLAPTMFDRIQTAYYLEARNPSEVAVLCSLAVDMGLDRSQFLQDIASSEVEAKLQEGFNTRRRLGVYSFPSLVLESNDDVHMLCEGYCSAEEVLHRWVHINAHTPHGVRT